MYWYPISGAADPADRRFCRRDSSETGYYHPVLAALLKGLQGEAQAVDFYARLAQAAPSDDSRRDAERMLGDEKKHLQTFSALYVRLAGRQPEYRFQPLRFETFHEGLERAFERKLAAYGEYRDALLLTRDADVRDVFFPAMSDELAHAVRLLRCLGK